MRAVAFFAAKYLTNFAINLSFHLKVLQASLANCAPSSTYLVRWLHQTLFFFAVICGMTTAEDRSKLKMGEYIVSFISTTLSKGTILCPLHWLLRQISELNDYKLYLKICTEVKWLIQIITKYISSIHQSANAHLWWSKGAARQQFSSFMLFN